MRRRMMTVAVWLLLVLIVGKPAKRQRNATTAPFLERRRQQKVHKSTLSTA